MSLARLGKEPWNKGKTHPAAARYWTGRKRSLEQRQEVSRTLTGKVQSIETRIKRGLAMTGSKHWNWKGGLSKPAERIRKSIEAKLWKDACFARDNWTCRKTGVRSGKLCVHHIQNFSQWPELRFAIDNGITLSQEAHREFHKKYGVQNNTKEQMDEFLNNNSDVC